MNRLAFLRRMALAAAACAFIDVPWPTEPPDRPRDPWTGKFVAPFDGVRMGDAVGRIVSVNEATKVVTVEWLNNETHLREHMALRARSTRYL